MIWKRILPFTATAGVFLILVIYFWHPIHLQGPNVDLGHHLLFGQIISQSGKIVNKNLVSYTFSDYKFVNSQWLAEVVFYQWHKVWGFNGLIILGVLLITTAFGLVFFITLKNNDWYSTVLVSLVYIQILIDRTEVKPELFSWLFLAAFIRILLEYREKYTKWIFLLIPISALWVNFHIYYFVGNVMLFLLLIDGIFFQKKRLKSGYILNLLIANFGCALATLLNPSFIKGATYPLFVLSNYGFKVIENYNFFQALKSYANVTFWYFSIVVLILTVTSIKYLKQVNKFELLIAIFFVFMSFYAVRDWPLFIIGTLVLSTRNMSFWLKSKPVKEKLIYFMVTILIILPGLLRNFEIQEFGLGVIDYANESVEFIKTNSIKGRIYNNYNIGNYLEYKIYPDEQVFVDGNPEEYPKEFFEKVYYPTEQSFMEFEKTSELYNFNLVYYDHINQTNDDNPVLYELSHSEKWKPVYLNYGIVVFIRNIPENQNVVEKNLITESNFKIPQIELADKNKLKNYSNIFRVMKWYEKMYEMDLKYLTFEPDNCTALRHIVAIMRQTNNPELQNYYVRYSQKCGSQ